MLFRSEAGDAIALIEHHRCTVIYATPNMVAAMAEHPSYAKERLSTLRTGITIGTPEQVRMLAEMGPTQICNVYGLTETYGNCAVTDAAESLESRCNNMGKLLPGFEHRVTDPSTGKPVAAGEVGELRVRGYVTCGYYKDEDKNRAAFDNDGFFLTGDLVFMDAEGYLHFRGREKEMIKTGGINVAPVEVEEILAEHPSVEQAFVVALPDAKRDEIVAAVIVPASGGADEAALREH